MSNSVELIGDHVRRRDSILAGIERFRQIDPNITVTNMVTFLYVCENEGISMTELAMVAQLGTATASRAVRSLGVAGDPGSLPPHLGLVQILAQGPKRNSKTLRLSPAGRELKGRLNQIIAAAVSIDG